MNHVQADYLKTIYQLKIESNEVFVSTKELSESLSITIQSVSEVVKRLVKAKLLIFVPYQGVGLTKNGAEIAIKLTRAHRLWECFLTKKLSYSWSEVHDAAEYLEHTDDVLIDRLDEYLGYPKYCSHGQPIPRLGEKLAVNYETSLKSYNDGDIIEIKRVIDNYEMLLFLEKHKIAIDKLYLIEKQKDTLLILLDKEIRVEIPVKYQQLIFAIKI